MWHHLQQNKLPGRLPRVQQEAMTTLPSTSHSTIDGRSVREIVEHNHEMVSEPWCRRIFRQLLQSLEVQYGMQMPHRHISPDTILILDAGDPMLLPSDGEASTDDKLGGDLRDLAAVMHYAITLELVPEGPLHGRALAGYSDSFLTAIDRCMAQDTEQRPKSIEDLRNLLGIVVLGAPQPITLDKPAPVRITEVPRRDAPAPASEPARAPAARRPLLLVIGGLILVAALVALVLLLRQSGARDAVPAPLAPNPGAASIAAPLETLPQGQASVLEGPVLDENAANVPSATQAAAAQAVAPPTAVQLAPKGAPAVAGTTYKLVIQPWGTIVVDGVERGVSPPLKHLTLPPGEHTIRVVNPSFAERSVTVQSVTGEKGVIAINFNEEKTP